MPFTQLIPRPFNAGGVHTYAPGASGLYGISNAREWIYIGETANIQMALLDQLQRAGAPAMLREPTGFVFELCGEAGRRARQDRLVFEYEPTCNRDLSRSHTRPGVSKGRVQW